MKASASTTQRPTTHDGARIRPLSEAIAQRIKAHRQVLGMSQEAFARQLDVTRQTISNWECARTIPDALALKRIATVCGTTADALLGDEAPQIHVRALAARREFVAVAATVLALQLVTMFLNGTNLGQPLPDAERTFAAFRLGVFVVGGLWLYRIARREGLRTIRQMIDFASLASKRPGSWGDRLLRFVGRWFWTLWIVLAAAMHALGTALSIAQGTANAADLIAPAFMLLIAAIPFTWERNAPKRETAR